MIILDIESIKSSLSVKVRNSLFKELLSITMEGVNIEHVCLIQNSDSLAVLIDSTIY